MKWFVLASIPVILTGFIYLDRGTELKGKECQPQGMCTTDLSGVKPRSAALCPDAVPQENPVSQTETEDNNTLLFKNIIVCIF